MTYLPHKLGFQHDTNIQPIKFISQQLEYFIDENKRVIGELEEEMSNYCLIGYKVLILKARVLEIEWPIM